MKILWGDIHNHCGITYGYGGLENALAAAREQLDFCTVTGHAMWDDIPPRTPELAFLVDYHKNGFAKLKQRWDKVRRTIAEANSPELVTFQGYEMHSSYYGDYHLLSPDDDLPLIDSPSPRALIENVSPCRAMVIPHHVGYTPGYRGCNWQEFDGSISPVVEVFSKHGCGLSDHAAYPYYHTMGPRDGRSTVFAGLAAGRRFGFAASTDHHAGYPGSYGDGRMAVLAEEKTREAIWDAIWKRRTYAVTGDKIKCGFSVNGAPMGSDLEAGKREIAFDVAGCDKLDRITIFKNLKPLAVYELPVSNAAPRRFKTRVELGWGEGTEGYAWDCSVQITAGTLVDAEPCFRGRSVLAPSEKMADNDSINRIENRIVSVTDSALHFTANTVKNPSPLQPATAAVILELEGDADTALHLEVNGRVMDVTVGELLTGGRSMHMEDYNSEACLVHRAVPAAEYCFSGALQDEDDAPAFYHMEVRQSNQQFAWTSPVYVNQEVRS